MNSCFVTKTTNKPVPITLVTPTQYKDWLREQSEFIQNWLNVTNYKAEKGNTCIIPEKNGDIARVICCLQDANYFWGVGHLPLLLPETTYAFENATSPQFAMVWGLGAYQFTRYKKANRQPAKLVVSTNLDEVSTIVDAIYFVRDLINTPTDDMGPSELACETEKLANHYHAQFNQIVGEELLDENYASIYTVGRASDDAPRLLDLRWGDKNHPKVTLIGKGVCFDTGGLDIKPSSYMLLMKKDMAGSAHVLGLAKMIMQAKLPICLRVLIPAVENAISGNAYRPGDVIKSRKGLTIEIGNTDAEGRVVLADAITEAVSENPDLLIDISTLTGAARVALGTELPAVFSNNNTLVNDVIAKGEALLDPMWQLPLFGVYREYLNSTIADINNNSTEPYAGAITAALFLKEFIPDQIPWLHFDMMAWNLRTKPGRPQGGEAMVLRALFAYLKEKYA